MQAAPAVFPQLASPLLHVAHSQLVAVIFIWTQWWFSKSYPGTCLLCCSEERTLGCSVNVHHGCSHHRWSVTSSPLTWIHNKFEDYCIFYKSPAVLETTDNQGPEHSSASVMCTAQNPRQLDSKADIVLQLLSVFMKLKLSQKVLLFLLRSEEFTLQYFSKHPLKAEFSAVANYLCGFHYHLD